jgi:hypothetical protein
MLHSKSLTAQSTEGAVTIYYCVIWDSPKVGTKIRRPVAVAHSVQFACELKATDLFETRQIEGPGPRTYIPSGTGWPSYTTGRRDPFSLPLTTSRVTVDVFQKVFTWVNIFGTGRKENTISTASLMFYVYSPKIPSFSNAHSLHQECAYESVD